jgi:transposase
MSSQRGLAHWQDLRGRALAAVDAGIPVYEAAPFVGVSVSFVYKALNERRAKGGLLAETGVPPASPRRGRPRQSAGSAPDGPVKQDQLDPAKTTA